MLKVTIHSQDGEAHPSQVFDMTKPVKVGSGPRSDLLLHHESVGDVHALFSKQGSDVGLVHLGSSTGTFINSEELEQTKWTKLSNDDEVRFGEISVKVGIGTFAPVFNTLNLDPVYAHEFLKIGSALTKLAYEERLYQSIWAGERQAVVLRIKKRHLKIYEKWATKYQIRGLLAPEESDKEETNLLLFKEDRVRELIEGWPKIQAVSNLTSAWFMAMLFQWPEKFIDDILTAAQERK
jgi:pSer/pThr/pTyr-binding forkhead associated (FHA) protein